jgi:hypothetical protein
VLQLEKLTRLFFILNLETMYAHHRQANEDNSIVSATLTRPANIAFLISA